MKIWITRHGQTDYNKENLMQGRRDIPLNEMGIAQAKSARELIDGVEFDAVYASPLIRAVKTASIIGNVSEDEIIKDERIIEVDFGKFDGKCYFKMGPAMMLYWAFPEVFSAPTEVEDIASMVERSSSFLKELEEHDYENVLIVCHGGIIRALCGYLEERPNGIKWRPRPENCEIRVYEFNNGHHEFIKSFMPENSKPAPY